MKKKCHSLKEVRKNIDRIDRKLVPLIGEREFYVKESLKFKYKKKDIVDKKRIIEVLKKIKLLSKKSSVNTKTTETFWKFMIKVFIDLEYKLFNKIKK